MWTAFRDVYIIGIDFEKKTTDRIAAIKTEAEDNIRRSSVSRQWQETLQTVNNIRIVINILH